jgi:hypothetical protein
MPAKATPLDARLDDLARRLERCAKAVELGGPRAHVLDDPKLGRKILADLDRAVADLRDVRVTIKKAKAGSS